MNRTKLGRILSAAATALIVAALLLPLLAFLTPSLSAAQGKGAGLPQLPGAAPAGFLPAYWMALVTSLFVAGMAAIFATVLGLAAAWGLHASGRRLGSFWTAVCLFPLTLPASVAVSGWVAVAAESAAMTTSAFAPKPSQFPSPGILFSPYGCAFILGSLLWPLVTLHGLPALRSAAASEGYAAARLAGTPARAFFKVAVRLAAPELLTGFAAVFLIALADFSVASLLLVRVFPVEVFEALSARYDLAAAAQGCAILLLVAAAVGMAVHVHTQERPSWQRSGNEGLLPEAKRPSRARKVLGLLPVLIVFGATYVLPMAVLASRCGGAAGVLEAVRASVEPLGTTLRLSVGAAALATGLAALLACGYAGRVPPALATAMLLLIAAPGAALASGVLRLFYSDASPFAGLLAGFPLLALGVTLRWSYVPLRLMDLGARSLPPDAVQAANLSGHGPRASFVGVGLPLLRGHMAMGFAAVFSLSVGEIAVASVLFPPGQSTLSVRLFEFQHYGYTESVFALAVTLGLLAAAPVILASIVSGWVARGERAR